VRVIYIYTSHTYAHTRTHSQRNTIMGHALSVSNNSVTIYGTHSKYGVQNENGAIVQHTPSVYNYNFTIIFLLWDTLQISVCEMGMVLL